ncbi:hypothetical protein HMPREF3024_09645 [Achromobacter xylosoxidans]|nr:hypothetical protein HMPREF3024_09645 [Achromobacter xylosoxidans]OMG81337.1 hypothetical protein BIZ53_29100 [Achromobacter xylosoxidans]
MSYGLQRLEEGVSSGLYKLKAVVSTALLFRGFAFGCLSPFDKFQKDLLHQAVQRGCRRILLIEPA